MYAARRRACILGRGLARCVYYTSTHCSLRISPSHVFAAGHCCWRRAIAGRGRSYRYASSRLPFPIGRTMALVYGGPCRLAFGGAFHYAYGEAVHLAHLIMTARRAVITFALRTMSRLRGDDHVPFEVSTASSGRRMRLTGTCDVGVAFTPRRGVACTSHRRRMTQWTCNIRVASPVPPRPAYLHTRRPASRAALPVYSRAAPHVYSRAAPPDASGPTRMTREIQTLLLNDSMSPLVNNSMSPLLDISTVTRE